MARTGTWFLILTAMATAAPLALAGGGHHASEDSIMPGETWSKTFADEGTWAYHCHPHPWMEGAVTVGPAAAAPRTWHVAIVEPTDDPNAWAYDPPALTIGAGDTVVWHNNGTIAHTVTDKSDARSHSHGHDDHAQDDAAGAPAPAAALVALAAVLVALASRRR